MGVIELNRGFVGQFFPIRVMPQEAPHQVSQRACHQKIFLHEAEFLAGGGGIVGIQNSRQRFRFEGSAQRTHKIASAKFLKIEEIRCTGGPEAESIDRLPTVPYNWTIEGNSEQAGWPIGNHLEPSIPQLEAAAQLNFHFLVLASDLPWVTVAQPIVGTFLLRSIHKRLPEHSVLVAQTVARRRKLHGGHRIQKARGEPSQAAITKTGIRFLLDQLKPVDSFFFDGMLDYGIKQQVRYIISQRTPKQKLH